MARIARSLDTLRTQVNAVAPGRSKSSDGWIGDAAHAASKSDHNADSGGVVRALDITHDPKNGFDSWAFAEMLRQKRDSRIKYVISNGRAYVGNHGTWNGKNVGAWAWFKYTGSNSHAHHVHISVLGKTASGDPGDDPRSWDIAGPWKAEDTKPAPVVKPLLRRGSPFTADVTALQRKLGLTVDGVFGPKTEAAVKEFQKKNGLTADGLVGPYTREKLGI
jgi:hypothetical protein